MLKKIAFTATVALIFIVSLVSVSSAGTMPSGTFKMKMTVVNSRGQGTHVEYIHQVFSNNGQWFLRDHQGNILEIGIWDDFMFYVSPNGIAVMGRLSDCNGPNNAIIPGEVSSEAQDLTGTFQLINY